MDISISPTQADGIGNATDPVHSSLPTESGGAQDMQDEVAKLAFNMMMMVVQSAESDAVNAVNQ